MEPDGAPSGHALPKTVGASKARGALKTYDSAKRTGLENVKLRMDVAGRQEFGTREKFFPIRFVWNEID